MKVRNQLFTASDDDDENESVKLYSRLTEMANTTLCPPNDDGYHSTLCLIRHCPKCGVSNLHMTKREKTRKLNGRSTHIKPGRKMASRLNV